MLTNLHKTLWLTLILCSLSPCKKTVAQENIKAIKDAYQTISNQISTCKTAEEPCGLYLATWQLNKNGEPWRAIRTHNKKINFWYKETNPEAMTYHPLYCIKTSE